MKNKTNEDRVLLTAVKRCVCFQYKTGKLFHEHQLGIKPFVSRKQSAVVLSDLLYLLAQLLAGSPSNTACKEAGSLFASQDFDRKEH